MPEKARIKLSGTDHEELERICEEIKSIVDKYGVSMSGPVPLPTKKLKVPVLKTPCGDGTGHGNASWDRYELRIHKRVIDVGADQRALRRIMRIEIPENVNIKIQLSEE